MSNNPQQYHVRRARIYKSAYRLSPRSFIHTILSILFTGHSPIGGSRLPRN